MLTTIIAFLSLIIGIINCFYIILDHYHNKRMKNPKIDISVDNEKCFFTINKDHISAYIIAFIKNLSTESNSIKKINIYVNENIMKQMGLQELGGGQYVYNRFGSRYKFSKNESTLNSFIIARDYTEKKVIGVFCQTFEHDKLNFLIKVEDINGNKFEKEFTITRDESASYKNF